MGFSVKIQKYYWVSWLQSNAVNTTYPANASRPKDDVTDSEFDLFIDFDLSVLVGGESVQMTRQMILSGCSDGVNVTTNLCSRTKRNDAWWGETRCPGERSD